MTRSNKLFLRYVVCALSVCVCIAWFTILSVTTQGGGARVDDAIIYFGWPCESFTGIVDLETFDEAGWIETFFAMADVRFYWGCLAANVAVLVVLCSSVATVVWTGFPSLRYLQLQHYFALLAFAAWYVWMDKSLLNYKDIEAEIVLRTYAQRATWIFVLAGCLSVSPILNMTWKRLVRKRDEVGIEHRGK